MNALVLLVIGLAVLIVGYLTYGRWLAYTGADRRHPRARAGRRQRHRPPKAPRRCAATFLHRRCAPHDYQFPGRCFGVLVPVPGGC